MIEVALRFRCDDCGVAIEMPQVLPKFPMRMAMNVPKEAVPTGWQVTEQSVHCPQHPPRQVQVAAPGVATAVADMKQILSKH